MHLSFGAILGVAAWGRTKETINGYGAGPVYPTPYNPYGGGGGYYQQTETEIQVPYGRGNPPRQPSQSDPQNGPNPPINLPPPRRPPMR